MWLLPALLALLACLFATASYAFGPPRPATEIAQVVSMQEASQAGLVQLQGKGGYSGDQVAVDLTGARIPGAPVQVTVRIELFGTAPGGGAWPASKALELKQAVETKLAGLMGSDGTPVDVQLDVKVRSGTAPTGGDPGYHQIQLFDWPARTQTNWSRPNGDGPRVGEFGANEDASLWSHEVLHMMGLPDRYLAKEPVLEVGDQKYPLPKYSGDGSMASLDAWWDSVLAEQKRLEAELGQKGDVQPSVPPGHENDIMANSRNPDAGVLESDIDNLVAGAGVLLEAKPGDLLLNKDPEAQNFGTGAPLELFAPRGKAAHVDGLYVFCIDFELHIPDLGARFDVLGPAADQPEPQLEALQAVLEEIALHQDPEAPDAPLGAQSAVWSITEGDPLWLFDESQAFLDAAGILYDQSFFADTPHFANPNAGGATTAGVTRSGLLPPIDAILGPPPPGSEPAEPQLLVVKLLADVLPAKRPFDLGLDVVMDQAPDGVRISLERRKRRRWLEVFSAEVGVHAGANHLELPIQALKRGKYRLRVTASSGAFEKTIKAKRRRL